MCLIEWLDCADLGVSQDWIGQVLWHMLLLFPGSNQEARVSSLWLRIQELYKVYPGPACVDNLTVRMIKPEGARAAKMKCYGAETRGLLPVVHHLVREMLCDDGVDGSIQVGTEHLSASYQCLSANTPFAADGLAEHCNRFAAARPASSWTDRDEEFGGVLVGTARRRWGQRTPSSTGNAVLRKFTARFQVPDLR